MANFADFEQVFKPLTLTIAGKEYALPAVAAIDKIRIETDSDNVTDVEFRKIMLGATEQQMIDDRVPDEAIQLALKTAFTNLQSDREHAAIMWATGGDPKAMQEYFKKQSSPNRASRRSKSTAAATKTP